MSLVIIQHHPAETADLLGVRLAADGHHLRTIELFDGASLPPDLDDIDGLLCLGGPMDLQQRDEHPWMAQEIELIRSAHEAQLPVLGICLGAQMIGDALGAKVQPMESPEVGFGSVQLTTAGMDDPLLAGLKWDSLQFHLHAHQITDLPAEAKLLANSTRCKVQAFRVGLATYGIQFHFEFSRGTMKRLSQDSMLDASGISPQVIAEQCDRHYESFHDMSDRLCENVATRLFAIGRGLMSV